MIRLFNVFAPVFKQTSAVQSLYRTKKENEKAITGYFKNVFDERGKMESN